MIRLQILEKIAIFMNVILLISLMLIHRTYGDSQGFVAKHPILTDFEILTGLVAILSLTYLVFAFLYRLIIEISNKKEKMPKVESFPEEQHTYKYNFKRSK